MGGNKHRLNFFKYMRENTRHQRKMRFLQANGKPGEKNLIAKLPTASEAPSDSKTHRAVCPFVTTN